MGLDFAVDDLYTTGWSALDTSGCERAADGRWFPGLQRVHREFEEAGLTLTLRHVPHFDCYRAEWREASGRAAGAVVGRTEAEAAVYAFARMRRQMAEAAA